MNLKSRLLWGLALSLSFLPLHSAQAQRSGGAVPPDAAPLPRTIANPPVRQPDVVNRPATVRNPSANPQPAILGAGGASSLAMVFPDATVLPNTAQKLVTGLPDSAVPHGIGYFGRDNALISDGGGSKIYVVKVSTAEVLSTINTSSVGYSGWGSIAISPDLSTALACGGSRTLFVAKAPFNASSPITPITLPGQIATYQTQAISFDASGRAFVYHSLGISVLDAPYTSIAFTIPVSNSSSGALAVSPDGNTLLTTSLTTTMRIFKAPFSAASTSTTLSIPSSVWLNGTSITPDGTKAIVVDSTRYAAFAVSAPFSASSTVESLPLPTNSSSGFEDVGISADGSVAILTGQSASSADKPVFIRAPFTAAGAQSFAVDIKNAAGVSFGRGFGAVRFLPPGLAPGLTISKSAARSVASGGNLTYTLTFQNTGTAAANSVIITDPIPAGTTFVSAANGGTRSGNNVVFNIGALAAGSASRTVSFTVRATGNPGSQIVNSNYTIAEQGVTPIPGPPVTTNVTAALPTVSVSGATVMEGNSGTTNANFQVRLSAASASAVTVNFSTQNGTAQAGSDFQAVTNRQVTFSPGTTTQTVAVLVNGDTQVEPDEDFRGVLSSPNGATLGTSSAEGTILNDDSPILPTLSIGDASSTEGNSGTKVLNFSVTLSAPVDDDVMVNYATSNGSAASGSDYVSTSGTLVIPADTNSAIIPVTINGDTEVEDNETFVVNLSQPLGATIADGQGVGTIINDDLPGLSIANAQITEGNSGTKTLNFTVTLTGVLPPPSDKLKRVAAATQAVTVNYATANGTATAGNDYVATSGSLIFEPGQTTRTIPVTINGDTVPEPNETFTVTLSQASGANINTATATGTIINDDVVLPTLSIADAQTVEGNVGNKLLTFRVTLSAASAAPVTVNFATANGTATFGTDYRRLSGTLTFPAGTTSQTISIIILGDTQVEPNETFTITLSSPTGATIADGSAIGTIVNDDFQGNVTGQLSISVGSAYPVGPYVPGMYGNKLRLGQEITLRNTGARITGPISVVLDNLNGNVTVDNKTGVTAAQAPVGSPYVNYTGNLETGQTVKVPVVFRAPAARDLTYTVRVLAGSSPR